jgi:hypothetical protein
MRAARLLSLARCSAVRGSTRLIWQPGGSARSAGEPNGSTGKQRGPKADPTRADRRELDRLERENARLKRRLEQAEALIEVQKTLGAAEDAAEPRRRREERMSAVRELAPRMDVPRRSARALSPEERAAVLALLRQPEFVDQAPQAVFAANLEQQRSFCSVRTMYRLLAQHGEVRERRHHLRHPVYIKPELLAEAPNQVWSWDITKLLGPTKRVVDA